MTMLGTSSGELAAILSAQANTVSVLFKPDAPPNDARAVRTWAGVMAAIASAASPVLVWIDCWSSGPYTIPAGTYEMRHALLVGDKLGNPDENKLVAPEGVVLRNLQSICSSMTLEMAPTTGPALVFDAPSPAQPPVFGLLVGSVLKNAGTRALADVAGGGGPGLILAQLVGGSVDGSSSAPIMALAPGAVGLLSLFAPGGNPGNMVSGNASTFLQIIGSTAPQTPVSIGFAGSFAYGPNAESWFGDTAHRPAFGAGDFAGFSYFDASIGKPVWWTGAGWVLADGTPA